MNIIILGDKFQKRMKSKGCVALFKIHSHTILDNQISSIRSSFTNNKIVYVYGFESKKFLSYFNKHIQPKDSNVVLIHNPDYIKYNYAYSLFLAKEYLDDDCIILFGEQILKNNTLSLFQKLEDSQVLVSPKNKNKLGCVIHNNNIANISYGLQNYVHNIYYLSKQHAGFIKQLLTHTDQYYNCFIFELINKLIDNEQIIKPLVFNSKLTQTIKI
jgi:choline kinase